MRTPFNLVEASIDGMIEALENGSTTAVELASAYLARIARYDRSGVRLNAVPILNPNLFTEAAASDARRRNGNAGPLEGVTFTVKDSYMARGLTVASGSPAFRDLVAQDDAFAVARIRGAGGVLLGKTNMPPMADGGMQRGTYGRAESPYNTNYLAAAYASGSSNGSAVAAAANLCAFGMGEETVSSGRSPASNNALCAYTPSRGVISLRGNWPLFPTRDVVVPHTRTMTDMLRVLDVVVVDDPFSTGDFWRNQNVVKLPAASSIRPEAYRSLEDRKALEGKRFGVPRMYLGLDPAYPIVVRPSILSLWANARAKLEALGATVVEVELPVVEKYEGDTPGGERLDALGILPAQWMEQEFNELIARGWETFLRSNNDPSLNRLADVDHSQIFPTPRGSLPDRYGEVEDYENRYRNIVKLATDGKTDVDSLSGFSEALIALESMRKELFEDWLLAEGLDGIVFPANADVAPADADTNGVSADKAWKNGVFYSNGNYVLRHLGIPSVTVPMGTMTDTRMPVGMTFAGSAYEDSNLLAYGYAFESGTSLRQKPALAPELVSDGVMRAHPSCDGATVHAPKITVTASIDPTPYNEGARLLRVSGTVDSPANEPITLTVDGVPVVVSRSGSDWEASAMLPAEVIPAAVGGNPVISQSLVVAHIVCSGGLVAGAYVEL